MSTLHSRVGASAMFAALALAGLTACDKKSEPASTPSSSMSCPTSGAPSTGVTPHSEGTPAASDRPGAAAMGAIEAGQAGGGAAPGKVAQPTAGDGAASAAK